MREIMVCRLCSSLVIDYRKYDKDEIPSPFVVEEVYPGLAQLSENANDGCEFCHLLGQLMMEYFDVTESGLEKPIRFQLRNARFYTESYGKVIEDDHNSDENRAYMLVMELAYGEASNTRDLFFAVYSNDDYEPGFGRDPMRRSLRRAVEKDPLSAKSVARMRGWVANCLENHDQCSIENDHFVPTRLLNVRDDVVALQHTAHIGPVPYVALSHCWGVPSAEEPMLVTETSTIEERLKGIPMDILPKNFYDAVKVTRALGYDYLWADSLCIVQDSMEDWGREAARMAEVYKYATVTIVPTSAISCRDGFLHHRSIRSARIPYIHPKDGVADGHIILHLTDRPLGHWDLDLEFSAWSTRGWTLQERLLSRRIIHFCTDRLHFECKVWEDARTEGDACPGPTTSYMSTFNLEAWGSSVTEEQDDNADSSCGSESSKSEGSLTHSASSQVSHHGASLLREDSQQQQEPSEDEGGSDISACSDDDPYLPFHQWYRVMQRYSERNFTYLADKLPAAEGLAREIASKFDVGRYFAGIWEFDLALGLLWKPTQHGIEEFRPRPRWSWPPAPLVEKKTPIPHCPEMTATRREPQLYRAPSWSWASRDTFTHWPDFPCNEVGTVTSRELDLLDGEIELQDASFQLEGESSFGRIKGGHLTLKAKLRRVSVSGPHKQEETRLPRFRRPDGTDIILPSLDDYLYGIHDDVEQFACAYFDDGSAPSAGDFFALRLVNQPPGYGGKGLCSGLILQESEDMKGAFVRVGLFVLIEEHLDTFDNIPATSITLV